MSAAAARLLRVRLCVCRRRQQPAWGPAARGSTAARAASPARRGPRSEPAPFSPRILPVPCAPCTMRTPSPRSDTLAAFKGFLQREGKQLEVDMTVQVGGRAGAGRVGCGAGGVPGGLARGDGSRPRIVARTAGACKPTCPHALRPHAPPAAQPPLPRPPHAGAAADVGHVAADDGGGAVPAAARAGGQHARVWGLLLAARHQRCAVWGSAAGAGCFSDGHAQHGRLGTKCAGRGWQVRRGAHSGGARPLAPPPPRIPRRPQVDLADGAGHRRHQSHLRGRHPQARDPVQHVPGAAGGRAGRRWGVSAADASRALLRTRAWPWLPHPRQSRRPVPPAPAALARRWRCCCCSTTPSG